MSSSTTERNGPQRQDVEIRDRERSSCSRSESSDCEEEDARQKENIDGADGGGVSRSSGKKSKKSSRRRKGGHASDDSDSDKYKRRASRKSSRRRRRSDESGDESSADSSCESDSGRHKRRHGSSSRRRDRHSSKKTKRRSGEDRRSSRRSDRHRDNDKKKRSKRTGNEKHDSQSPSSEKLQFGYYGILKESDMHKSRVQRSFDLWLSEVKGVPSSLPKKWELVNYFKEYAEDYNTVTLPHIKYYDYDKWEMDEYNALHDRSTQGGGTGVKLDEYEHAQELKRKARQKQQLELERIKATFNAEKVAEMKQQAVLKTQLMNAYKVGDVEARKKLERRLEPEEKKKR